MTASIRLVVFDWAGTTVDHGCFGPMAAFTRTFALHNVAVNDGEVRAPMGLHKRDHLRALLQMPAVASRWRTAHSRDWSERDLDRLYKDFIPLQLEVIAQHSRLVPGLLKCVEQLRGRGIKIGATTGYFQEAADRVYQLAAGQGFVPDACLCAEEVPEGRPAPWMIYRIMERLEVYPPRAVVKVGDTVPDIHEGLNAGVWSVGVTEASSDVGCAEEEWAALAPEDRRRRLAATRAKLVDAGAHAAIDSLSELPALIANHLSERGVSAP
jgi:phosphonoacetaldehyde hydrolase